LPLSNLFVVVLCGLMLAACGTGATPVPPTPTPRPTLEARPLPTPIPEAQSGGEIGSGEAVRLTLPGGSPVDLLYIATEAQTVTITARALTDDNAGNPLDVVLAVHDAERNRIAYDDDGARNLNGFAATDAALTALALPAGQYTLRVNAFNGVQAGEVEVQIEND